jgi:hypothetical protein
LAGYKAQTTSYITLPGKWKPVFGTENQQIMETDKAKGCIPS